MSAPYPWLETAWQRLLSSRARPAQALLLAGPRGVGKGALALAWAQALLCETPQADGAACGHCPACHWFDTGGHPDFRLITLQEKTGKEGDIKLATAIEVDQARDAVDFVQLSTYRAGFRVVLVNPANSLNLAAANALLKVLEEPPLNTVFVLVSDQPRRLLPTIRSRCTRLNIGLPAEADSAQWLATQQVGDVPTLLALAGGAPLDALNWSDDAELDARRSVLDGLARPRQIDPVALADSWKMIKLEAWHTVAYKWLADLLAVRLQGRVQFNCDFGDVLTVLGKQVDVSRLLALVKTHADAGRTLTHPLNRALQQEAWLIQYRRLFREEKQT